MHHQYKAGRGIHCYINEWYKLKITDNIMITQKFHSCMCVSLLYYYGPINY